MISIFRKRKCGRVGVKMIEEKKWKLIIKGELIVPGKTFQEADQLFGKAMKAIAEVWDVDVEGYEVVRR